MISAGWLLVVSYTFLQSFVAAILSPERFCSVKNLAESCRGNQKSSSHPEAKGNDGQLTLTIDLGP